MQNPSEINIDTARAALKRAIARAPKGTTLKSLSLALGRNQAYLHQFLYRGSPRTLPEGIRIKLAHHLQINEHRLRPATLQGVRRHDDTVSITYIDHPSHSDHIGESWVVPTSFLSDRDDRIAQIKLAIAGDTTRSLNVSLGDMVMIDTSDCDPLVAGFFAHDMGSHIRVRHIEQVSKTNFDCVISDGGDNIYVMPLASAAILGRVIFHARLYSHAPPSSQESSSSWQSSSVR